MDILEKYIEYFYKHNFTFDLKKEDRFREQIMFAREHYAKTDKFLKIYYNTWCNNQEAFVLPYGVFRTLFYDEWPKLAILWIQKIKLRDMKK